MTKQERLDLICDHQLDLDNSGDTVKRYKKLLKDGKDHPFGPHVDLEVGITAHRKAMRWQRKQLKSLKTL